MKEISKRSSSPEETPAVPHYGDSRPTSLNVLIERAIAHHRVGQLPEAEALYREVLRLMPDHPDALHLLGVMATQAGEYDVALKLIDRSIQINPSFADAWNNRGNALYKLHRYELALESYDKGLLLKPDDAASYNNRCNALYALGDYQRALESCNRAIQLNPHIAEAWSNRGNLLQVLGELNEALESYNHAITCSPDYADAYGNRGTVLYLLSHHQEALKSYAKALHLKPEAEYLPGQRLFVKSLICDWENIDAECQQLETRIARSEKVATPFDYLALSNSPAFQKQVAEIFVADKFPSRSERQEFPRWPKESRIRIGYYSADYYSHATSVLIAGLFESHDRDKFEIFGFSFGPLKQDEITERVSAAVDHFIDVRHLSDRAVAQISRERKIDIAVDLKGFTKNSRAGIFAERAAGIQVNYLGYPGTMAADYMDYLVADSTLIPESSKRFFKEKIVYLPDSYQVNDSKRPIAAKPFTRLDAGLPEHCFVFCSFNNCYKITPNTYDVWMRILGQVEGSVLWLLEDNPEASANLRQEAARRGISPDRIIFATRLPLDEHLARHRIADLFLDTFPCNAHTTASDALWAGLPVLTRSGESFASRVAASLLQAIGLPELITTTAAEYESLAVELARDTSRYRAIRLRLDCNRLAGPLFDVAAYSRHLEAGYVAMYERYHAGLPPEHIYVSRLAPSQHPLQSERSAAAQ